MPTPVSIARQCLTEEAARALDDAVAVARRRGHAQTTSLHAVSALLALPSSALREACARARSSAYSPRLQFRALELSVSVSLDRLPSSKGVGEAPVSNSLMAAIKRSQANQRRHPETFQLYQQNQSSLSCVKVELKHFILSILDDPIVSRVLGEAGFRSSDVKLAILRPPSISRFPSSRCPPLFLCNLSDWDSNIRRFKFPFPGISDLASGDENYRRIGEILMKKNAKNPLLIGFCAKDALSNFTECIQRSKPGVLPAEIDGVSVICIEKEIREFVDEGGSEEIMGLKFKELNDTVERCTGSGVVVNYGELKVFVNGGSDDAVNYVVSEMSRLVEDHGGKLWLIGAAGRSETYSDFLARFPSVDKKWDLHLLPITSTKPCIGIGGSYSKPSLMGSFVPFGGFFPTPSEFENLSSGTNQSITRCDLCNEKYEQEASVILKGGSTISVADPQSPSLSSWLQKDPSDTSKIMDAVEAKDGAVLNAKLIGLQRKWNDICHRLHPTCSFQQNVTSVTTDLGLGTLYSSSEQKPERAIFKEDHKDSLHSFSGSVSTVVDRVSSNASNCITLSSPCSGPDLAGQLDEKDFKYIWRVLSEQVGWQDEAISTISQIVSHCRAGHGRHRGSGHRRDIWLSFLGPDKVGKKKIAVALAEIMFGSRESLISVDLSSEEDGISSSNSIFDRQGLNSCDIKFRGKMVVDYIAEELKSKPRSVMFLENLEKADFLAQNRLSWAIRSGKFLDSHGRDISINNMIFVTTSSIIKVDKQFLSGKEPPEFSEERILGAKALQMEILVGSVTGDATRTNGSNVFLMPRKETSTPVSVNKRKFTDTSDSTEQDESLELQKRAHKVSKSCLDLNMPVEEMEEEANDEENSEMWLEDFSVQVDEKVVFKPFNFDALAEEVLKEIGLNFRKTVGFDVQLEIDPEVMVQILAAAWLSDRKRAVLNWIEAVLCGSFAEARKKHGLTTTSVVKLVAVEGLPVEERAPHVCLPARIILH